MRDCGCHPYAEHALLCPGSPIFAQLVLDTAAREGETVTFGRLDDPLAWGRWQCLGDGSMDSFHTGGPINGFIHYCPAVRAIVG